MQRMVGLAGIVALLLAACGEAAPPVERVHAASTATTAARTAAYTMEMAVELGEDGSGMNMTVAGDGAVDFDSETGWMEMEIPGVGMSLRTVMDGDAVYTQVPPMLGDVGAGWIRQDAGEITTTGMDTTGGFGDDPTGMVDALADVDGDVTELGADEVRGDAVQGYGVTLTGDMIEAEQELPGGLADLEMPTEVWLDGDDRLRRLVTEIDMGAMMEAGSAAAGDDGAAAGGELDPGAMFGDMAGTMRLTMELFDFGEPVDVEVPDDADVLDADELEQMMQPEGGEG